MVSPARTSASSSTSSTRDGQIAALGTPAALGRPTLEDTFVALTDRAQTDRALTDRAQADRALTDRALTDGPLTNHTLTDRRPR
jgi:hypothetical protein